MGLQVALVERCISQKKLKNALHCAQRLGLDADFPDLERLQREDTVARLCKKQLWPQACRHVEDNPQLQASTPCKHAAIDPQSIVGRAALIWSQIIQVLLAVVSELQGPNMSVLSGMSGILQIIGDCSACGISLRSGYRTV